MFESICISGADPGFYFSRVGGEGGGESNVQPQLWGSWIGRLRKVQKNNFNLQWGGGVLDLPLCI